MSRHYGLRVGDRVEFKAFGVRVPGEIVELFVTDNNGGLMRRADNGKEMTIVCEWCVVLPRTAQCPDCGEAVYSIFDHVDRDKFCTTPNTDEAAG